MSNVATLQNAGLIPQNANFSPSDTQIIESLSPAEVNALISISQKLTPDFIARNFGGGGGAAPAAAGGPARPSLGIVF